MNEERDELLRLAEEFQRNGVPWIHRELGNFAKGFALVMWCAIACTAMLSWISVAVFFLLASR